MRQIAFIGCSKNKSRTPCKAKYLYQGVLFKKLMVYCIQEQFDEIWILSAKYGLLNPEDEISPYECTLNSFTKAERIEWSNIIKSQIKKRIPSGKFHFFCGKNYHEYLQGLKPLSGLTLGKSLRWVNQRIKKKGGFDL